MASEHFPSLVLGRRLALLIALHHRPHTLTELYQTLNDQGYGADDTVPGETVGRPPDTWMFKLRDDLRDLKALGYEVGFHRKSNCYRWTNSPFRLVLEDEHLAALTLLQRTFSDQTFPRVAEIRAFLDDLVTRLSPEQAHMLDSIPAGLVIQLTELGNYENIDLSTLRSIEAAINARRQLEFDYQSPKHENIVRHCINIESFVFKDGHFYLYGWEAGRSGLRQYRIERIVPGSVTSAGSAQRLVHYPYRIQYWLAPAIARGGISPRFDNTEAAMQPDGSVVITAETSDLWEAHKVLLGYGAQARAVAPPALVDLMREAVRCMGSLYGIDCA
jgi:predicted DNA-binding transcriptional regulator YafY